MTTRLLVLVFLTAALAVAPSAHAWFGPQVFAGQGLPGAPPPPGIAGSPGRPSPVNHGPVAPPHPSGAAVVELLEDDGGRLARSLNPGKDQDTLARAGAWAADCFSGATALKVAGYQRHRETIPGWTYPVVGTPKPGEYRYLRFAWKRPEGRGVMIQLCAGGLSWGRYFSGDNVVGLNPALQVSPQVPRDWEVVTRDLYADFAQIPFTLTGMAFTSMDGVALFDHIYLGRTIEDLDQVTGAAKRWARTTDFLRPAQLDQLWRDVGHEDAAVRQPAVWALGACGGTSVPHIRVRVALPDSEAVERRIVTAVAELDAPRYPVRERAGKDLSAFGPTALPHLEAALKKDGLSPEWRTRLEKLVAEITAADQVLTTDQKRTLRVIHILEQAETAEALDLLARLAKGGLEAGLSMEAKGALERAEKRRK